MAQHNGFSLDQAIENKHNYNLTRKDWKLVNIAHGNSN
jgi:hypothetical protein